MKMNTAKFSYNLVRYREGFVKFYRKSYVKFYSSHWNVYFIKNLYQYLQVSCHTSRNTKNLGPRCVEISQSIWFFLSGKSS